MKSHRRVQRLGRLARGGAAGLLIAILVIGVPWGLTAAVGWPLPHHVPTLGGLRTALGTRGIPDRTLLDSLVCVAWLTWALVVLSITEEVVVTISGRKSNVLPFAGAFQPVAARLVATVLFAVLALARPEPPAASVIRAPLAQQLQTNVVVLTADLTSNTPTTTQSLSVPSATTAVTAPIRTYTVVPNDCLWSIAETQLGDGADWPAIATLNLGRTMPDGRRFVDPNLIYPGWVLVMPESDSVATPLSDMRVPGAPSTPVVSPNSDVSPNPVVSASPTLPSALKKDGSSRSRLISPNRHKKSASRLRHGHAEATQPGASNLPELAVLGVGAIGCAALARRSRRIRLLRHINNRKSEPAFEPSELAIDTDTLLSRFAGVPALRAFELANCQLSHALSLQNRSEASVHFRAISVGASGIDFWLHESGLSAPNGFTLSGDGKAWHLGHDDITWTDTTGPYLPIALPIGEDETGTWLVPLRPGDHLPLLGEAADDLWRAVRPVQEAWSWADLVLVTDDPRVVEGEVKLLSNDDISSPDDQQILFFGDPQVVPIEQRRKISIVTTLSTRASDVTVLVDRDAATIHPLGRTVRPHLMGQATASVVDELVASPIILDDASSHDSGPVGNETIDAAPYIQGPGTVEVRLLTMTPRLEGLRYPLPPNRTRRATELVAYLALHRPDVVTSDRLRTRVLGSADADAASKTLFNIASAARRAMGTDPEGTPLFPPGNRTGHYQVSEAVTTDVQRAAGLATMGSSAEDPNEAMALLRAALDLVEGEPLANALSGYTWWEAEGHGARIAAVAVNAACNLAALAVDAGLFDLAQWGLGQARLVDPYSESVSRAAMQVAAAAGDADQLRREWRECQRRIDELDPGSTPSPRTERLYCELSERVLTRVSSGHEE